MGLQAEAMAKPLPTACYRSCVHYMYLVLFSF